MSEPPARFQPTGWNDVPWAIAWALQLVGTLAASVYAIIVLPSRAKTTPLYSKTVAGGWQWVGVGIILALVLACAVLAVLRKWTRHFIVACNVLYIGLLFAFGILLLCTGSLIGGIFTLLFAAFFIWWFRSVRDRIPFATLMLRSATTITVKYPAMTALTFLGFLLVVGYTLCLLFLVALCQSVTGLWVLLAFLFFWTAEVIQNVAYTTCCGVAAAWYFLRDQASNPTKSALLRCTTTSFGSICLGSLLVALLKTVRLCLRMVIDQLQDEGACGMAASFVLCCVEALIQVIEDLLEYFNDYAYAQVAIYGKKYTVAAKDTITLFKDCGLMAIINDCLIDAVFAITSVISGLVVGIVVGSLSWEPVFGVFGFLIGFYLCTLVLGSTRACVITLFVCFAEQPQVLQLTDPELFQALENSGQARSPADVEQPGGSPSPPSDAPLAPHSPNVPYVPYGQPVTPGVCATPGSLPPHALGGPVDTVQGANGPLCVGLRVQVQPARLLQGAPAKHDGGAWCEGTVEMVQLDGGLVGIQFDGGGGGMAAARDVYLL